MAGETIPPALLILSLRAQSNSSKYSSTRWCTWGWKMSARLDQPYKRLKKLKMPSIHSLRTNIDTKSDHETGSSPRAAYWSQSKKWEEYIATLQKGHGAYLCDKKEKRVRLAKNKITSLADSNGIPPKRSPNALGMDRVEKRGRRWEEEPRSSESRRFLANARDKSANISLKLQKLNL